MILRIDTDHFSTQQLMRLRGLLDEIGANHQCDYVHDEILQRTFREIKEEEARLGVRDCDS